MGLGSSQEPLTCLWQLWRNQRRVVRVGGAPPNQAVQAPALGVEAVAGQPGLCQSPSQVRWGRGPLGGWGWGQGELDSIRSAQTEQTLLLGSSSES